MNKYMNKAIEIAKNSDKDVPVGAIIVKDNNIIAISCNQREMKNETSAHAEILAIQKANKVLNNWRLDECDMYVTLEPCPMCGWAIIQSRIKNLYFGSYDFQYGAFSSSLNLKQFSKSNINVFGGICEKECDDILKKFFHDIR